MSTHRKVEDADTLSLLPRFGQWREEEIAPWREQIAPPSSEFEDWFDTLSAAEILSSDTCLGCGGVKKSGETIDAGCYSLLPAFALSMFPPRVNNYIVRPPDSATFKDHLKTALALIAEERERRAAAI